MSAGPDWIDVDKLLSAGWLGSCEVLDVVDSTNTFALQRAAHVQERELPLLVVARRQTGGRGRGANTWWSAEGSVTCTLLLAPSEFRLGSEQWPMLSVLVGSAVCSALSESARDNELRLKWPNDVYLLGRKVCGILVEAPSVSEDRIVIGMGINVNNSFSGSPNELASSAISLSDATGNDVNCLEVLDRILRQLRRDLERLRDNDSALVSTWRSQCLLTGRQIVVDDYHRRVEGTCLGIDDDGALRVQTRFGPQRVVSGVVSEF